MEPCLSCDEIRDLLNSMPKSIKEVCIYTSEECENIAQFVKAEISQKFEYLELGFSQLKLPVEPKHILDVARNYPNSTTFLEQRQLKNDLISAITVGDMKSRFRVINGPESTNQFGYNWFEVIDKQRRVTGRESKMTFKSVRRNQEDNAQHTIGIAFKELYLTIM